MQLYLLDYWHSALRTHANEFLTRPFRTCSDHHMAHSFGSFNLQPVAFHASGLKYIQQAPAPWCGWHPFWYAISIRTRAVLRSACRGESLRPLGSTPGAPMHPCCSRYDARTIAFCLHCQRRRRTRVGSYDLRFSCSSTRLGLCDFVFCFDARYFTSLRLQNAQRGFLCGHVPTFSSVPSQTNSPSDPTGK